ncbi:hypothetical protein LguiA_030626 [Lonicera macranthoides]
MALVFSLLLLISVHQSFATRSFKKDDLVEQVCKTTTDPSLCLSTLRSNPRSSSSDVKGLAHIMLEVSLRKGSDNFSQVKKLVQNAKDPIIKQCLDLCVMQYDLLIDDVNEAIHYLESNSFRDANLHAGWAADGAETCENCFIELKRPSPLTEQNNLFVHLGDISLEIIHLYPRRRNNYTSPKIIKGDVDINTSPKIILGDDASERFSRAQEISCRYARGVPSCPAAAAAALEGSPDLAAGAAAIAAGAAAGDLGRRTTRLSAGVTGPATCSAPPFRSFNDQQHGPLTTHTQHSLQFCYYSRADRHR